MKLSDIIRQVQRLFGDESGAQITTNDIVDWANLAQLDIARKTEALADVVEINSVAGQRKYLLPENFLKLRRVSYDGRLLDAVSMEEVDDTDRFSQEGGTGEPKVYFLWGREIFLHPTPSQNGVENIDLYYVRSPAELTVGELNAIPELPPAYHEDIVRYCLARAKELDEEDDTAVHIMSEYELRLAQSKDEAWSPDIDSYPAVRVLPGDY